jgi:MFS family permease
MTLYVTETLHLNVMWAGIALGVAAALEVPALIFIGRLSDRYSHLGLIATGCLAGIAYYLGLAFVTGAIVLIALQVLNAWFFAGIAGIGLPLFQRMIARPGLSTGLYMNTRRVGSIVSGPIIAIGSLTVLGQRGIFLTSAALTLIGLVIIASPAERISKSVTTGYLRQPESARTSLQHATVRADPRRSLQGSSRYSHPCPASRVRNKGSAVGTGAQLGVRAGVC